MLPVMLWLTVAQPEEEADTVEVLLTQVLMEAVLVEQALTEGLTELLKLLVREGLALPPVAQLL